MASGKHALLVGCSFCSVPMLFALKRLGLTVSVCGRVQHDPAHDHADQSFFIDYSKPDQFRPLVEQGGFDFLVPPPMTGPIWPVLRWAGSEPYRASTR